VVALGLGGAAIAIWIEVRFPKLSPEGLGWAMGHVMLAVGFAQLVVPNLLSLLTGSYTLMLVGLMAVAFPALTYCLLAGLWMFKLAQRTLGTYR
jgi:hypothetical protein